MPEYDPQEEQVVKKLDQRIIPILVLSYLVALINRTNIDYARVNLEKNMGMKEWQFIVCLAGSFPFVLPSTLLVRFLQPARWIGLMMCTMGFLACCMAGAHNWQGLFVVRIFFGAAQAGFVPGILLYLASFYTRDERTVRLSFVVGVATCASTFGAVFAKSLERLDGVGGSAGWKWLFIMEGLPAMIMGVVIWLLLPSFPETTLFLSPADRLVAASRVKDEDESEPTTPGTRAHTTFTRMATNVLGNPRPPPYRLHIPHLRDIFTDPQFYLLAIIYLCLTVSADALAQLAPEIAAGTFTRGQGATRYSLAAALISVAPFGVAAGCSIMWAYRSDRTGDRGLHIAVPLVVAGVGFAAIALIPESRWREVPLEKVELAVEQMIGTVKGRNVTASLVRNATGVVVATLVKNLTALVTPAPVVTPMPMKPSPTSGDASEMWIQPWPLPSGAVQSETLDAAELNLVAEQADLLEGGDGGVTSGALRYFFGLLPASVGLLSALPSLLALAIDRAHGSTAREGAAALVTAMGSIGGGVFVPLLFPPSQAPDEDAEGVATWGRGYGVGCGILAVGCCVGAGLAMIVRWIKLREDQGLRRLLNDAEEKGAWDDGDANESFGVGISDMMIAGHWGGKGESTENVGPDSEWDLKIAKGGRVRGIR
ncbi:major facilitator superfamily domain-containing protein, partial [Chytridium lagenaria]